MDSERIRKMKNWIRNLKKWSLNLAGTRQGAWALFICAFADASFFPLPVTTYFLILIYLNKEKLYRYFLIVLSGTVTGALAGFIIGHFAWLNDNGEFTRLGHFLLNNIPGFSERVYSKIHVLFAKWDVLILFAATATPVPYGIFSIFSGAFEVNIFVFLFATIIGQGVKYFILALTTLKMGVQINRLKEFNWKPVVIITTAFIGVLIFISNLFKNLFQIN